MSSSNSNIIYKNKGETFKCSFDIDGASSGDIKVRLCLEFNDNKNMFFNGKIDKKGNCVINIPKLSEIEDKQGNLRIEAIIDDTYFNLYESPIELKNSIQMKIKENTGTFFNNSSSSSGVKIQFGSLEKETNTIKEENDEPNDDEVEAEEEVKETPKVNKNVKKQNKMTEETIEESIDESINQKFKENPYINPNTKKDQNNEKQGKLKSFDEFWNKKIKKN